MTSPEPLVQIQNNFTEMSLKCPLPKLHKWFRSTERRGNQSSRLEMTINNISRITGPNSKQYYRNVPHDALYQNCSESSAWLNNMAIRA